MRKALLLLSCLGLLPADVWTQGWTLLTGRLEASTPVAIVQSSRTGRLWVSTGWALYTASTVGAAWSLVTSFPLPTTTLALALDGATEALLAVTPYGLWRSVDGGASWSATHPLLADRGARLRLHPTYPNVVLGLRGQFLWRSTDAGASWESIPLPPGFLFEAVPFGAIADILAWTSQGLFRSTDGGNTWEGVTTSLPPYPPTSLATTGGIEATLFVLIRDTVYRTSDGLSWTATHAPVALRSVFASGSTVAAVAPGALLLLRPDNSWEPIYTGWTDHITVLLPIGPDRLLVGSEIRGVELYRWFPQSQWQPLRTGMDTPPISWLFHLPGTATLIVGSPSGVFWSDTDISGLDNIALSLPKPATIMSMTPIRGGLIVATRIGIYRYTRATGEWTTLAEELPLAGAVTALAASPSGDTLLALSELEELIRSTDSGRTWQTLSLVHRVSSLERQGTTFYAFGFDGIFYSMDAGVTWTQLTSYPGGSCYFLAFHSSSPSSLLASSAGPMIRNGSLYRSTDGGASWHLLPTTELPTRGLTALATGRAPQRWYAGTLDGEVFVSPDDGRTWYSLGVVADGLPIQTLLELDPHLLAGIPRGLWQNILLHTAESRRPEISISVLGAGLLLSFREATTAAVSLYDLVGRCLGQWRTPGPTQSFLIPLPGVASGVYLLRLSTEGSTQHVRLALP